MEKNSIAWEMLKTIKIVLIIISIFAILELCVIGYLGYLVYDGQFDYVTDKTQSIEQSELDNSYVTQN